MHDLSDWNRLDAAAYRVSVKRSVRRLGGLAAVIGTVALACGIGAGLVPLSAVGAALLCAGVWNLHRPSVTGLVVDGVALVLTGAFNCLAWLWIEDPRGSSAGNWILTGLFQIAWGVRRLAFYRAARFAVNDLHAIARLESLVRELSKRSASADPAVVEFRTGRIRHHRNRIGLYDSGAIALLEQQVVRLEKRADIWIEAIGTTSLGRSVRVRIQMGDLHLMGVMSAAHFEKFEHWKSGSSQPLSMAA